MRDITARLKRLEKQAKETKSGQIVFTIDDYTFVYKNDDELIDDWLAGFEDEE